MYKVYSTLAFYSTSSQIVTSPAAITQFQAPEGWREAGSTLTTHNSGPACKRHCNLALCACELVHIFVQYVGEKLQ